MRSEEEMYGLILGAAKEDERVRAVWLNGSRANPNAKRDIWQDYDVVFAVTDVAPFLADRSWLGRFGKIAVMQEPDAMDMALGTELHDFTRSYMFLILFEDGCRIDLRLLSRAFAERELLSDSLTVLLLDKDKALPALPPPSEKDYLIKKPSRELFAACCNEFWWCMNNVGKGAARGELVYTMYMLNEIVRPQLIKMLDWSIGAEYGFSVSAGKLGKRYPHLLSAEDYARLEATYPRADFAEIKAAALAMCGLFSARAKALAAALGYTYSQSEEDGLLGYLKLVF